MNAQKIALLTLIILVLAWIGLAIGRAVATRYMQHVTDRLTAYYRSQQREGTTMPPTPVEWDYHTGKIVAIAPERVTTQADSSGFGVSALLVRQEAQERPWWVRGLWLAHIPPGWLHGVFGGFTLVLGLVVLWLRR